VRRSSGFTAEGTDRVLKEFLGFTVSNRDQVILVRFVFNTKLREEFVWCVLVWMSF
jgi:hypothetical protein